ncbi:MAG: sigma-54 interaction domain-containing protein [Proteocatella sp.]
MKKKKFNRKTVVIVTRGMDVSDFYKKQIERLFTDSVDVKSYSTTIYTGDNSIGENAEPIEKGDIYLITTDAFASQKLRQYKLGEDVDYIELKVDLTENNIRELLELEDGTAAMLVNMSSVMAKEVISRLSQLGINHINFIPVYPEMKEIPNIDLAVTPGEQRFVPKNVKRIIDIGHRSIDIETIVELALKLEREDLLESERFKSYFQKMAKKNYSIDRLYGKSSRLETQFERLLSALDDGIVALDEKLDIFAVNEKALKILNLNERDVIGSNVLNFIPQLDLSFKKLDYKEASKLDIETKVININGTNISMTIFPTYKNDKNIGAFIKLTIFSEDETKQQKARLQLLTKGHTAKYTFDDIVGNSHSMKEAIRIAKKMAITSAPILIEGESGTGKELFAHAIHDSSQRRGKPFIAINCAAMPDNLLESELFGYEEGAFTGAKNGGKLGLFEFAHTGTLFLDEVEAMSQALQVRLLRVLQEHEVMRLGGHRIINVDVRIIAATNINLEDMVATGQFRKDLYYRLNTIQIEIPPLRERKEDLELLINSMKSKIRANYTISNEVLGVFFKYPWDGNVRELQNYIEYFSYLEKKEITIENIPPNLKKKLIGLIYKPDILKYNPKCNPNSYLENPNVKFVISEIRNANKNNINVGRRTISKKSLEIGIKLSEQQVRTILDKLEKLGIIEKNIGRKGCILKIQ